MPYELLIYHVISAFAAMKVAQNRGKWDISAHAHEFLQLYTLNHYTFVVIQTTFLMNCYKLTQMKRYRKMNRLCMFVLHTGRNVCVMQDMKGFDMSGIVITTVNQHVGRSAYKSDVDIPTT